MKDILAYYVKQEFSDGSVLFTRLHFYPKHNCGRAIGSIVQHSEFGSMGFGPLRGAFSCYIGDGPRRYYKTMNEAMQAVDEYLISLGYILLSQDQTDKLSLLL